MKKVVILLVGILSLLACTKSSEPPGLGQAVELKQGDVDKGLKSQGDEGGDSAEKNREQKEDHEDELGASVELHVFEISSDRSVLVPRGEPIVFSLEANPTTGYRWTSEIDGDSKLQLIGEDYKSQGGVSLVGQGGRQYFKFKALIDEPGMILFKYSRTPENKAIKTFRVDIHYK